MQTYDDELRKFTVVSEKNVEQLRSLAETISSLVSTFESLGKEAELESSYHVRQAVDVGARICRPYAREELTGYQTCLQTI